jgi:hypothetical protein
MISMFQMKIAMVVSILFVVQSSFAQSENKSNPAYSKYEVGTFVNFNFPKFSHGNPLDFIVAPTGPRLRIGLKGFARFYPARWFYTEFQLQYSPEGGGYHNIRKTNVNYLNANLLAGFVAFSKKRVSLDLHVGYSLGKLINASYKDTPTDAYENVSAYFTPWKGSSILGLRKIFNQL